MPGPDFDAADGPPPPADPTPSELDEARRRLRRQVAGADLPALLLAELALAAGSPPFPREPILRLADRVTDLLRRPAPDAEAREEARARIRRNEETWRRWLGLEG